MKKHRFFCLAASFITFGSLLFAQESDIRSFSPSAYPIERYRHIWEKSPFVTEMPVIQQSEGLAARFVLTGVASLEGKPVIFVLDRQSLGRAMVSEHTDKQGLALVSVQSHSDPKEVTAIVRLGSEQGTIRYDLAALQSIAQPSTKAEIKSPSTTATPEKSSPTSLPQMQSSKTNIPPRANAPIRRPRPINLGN